MSSETGIVTAKSHWNTPALDRPIHAREGPKELLLWLLADCITSTGGVLDIMSHQCDLNPANEALGRVLTDTSGREDERGSQKAAACEIWNECESGDGTGQQQQGQKMTHALESNCPIRKLFVPFCWLTSLHQLHRQLENVHKMYSS